ncbi:MAG: hypothetical protein HYV34_03855 [Candidatus Kerfeldbacteria bacterium]|nr:hypothetical protein [Candidatus Kerfeldbacteria bacterium]
MITTRLKEIPETLPQNVRHLLSAPFIYVQIVPLVILDLGLTIYHEMCFPLYGIPKVKRSEYIKIDRQKLGYLDWMQKLNCAYCGYANGLIMYAQRIAGDTERYWCPIKHKNDPKHFHAPPHHRAFAEYGDADEFHEKFNTFDS